MPKMWRKKRKYPENEKSLKMKWTAFFIIFQGLSLQQIKKKLEGESPTLFGQDKQGVRHKTKSQDTYI